MSITSPVPKCLVESFLEPKCPDFSIRHFGTIAQLCRPKCPGAEVSRLFIDLVPKCVMTLRHHCRSVSSKIAWCRSVPFFRERRTAFLVPLRHRCRSVSCGSEVSCGRSVLWPKCPVTTETLFLMYIKIFAFSYIWVTTLTFWGHVTSSVM